MEVVWTGSWQKRVGGELHHTVAAGCWVCGVVWSVQMWWCGLTSVSYGGFSRSACASTRATWLSPACMVHWLPSTSPLITTAWRWPCRFHPPMDRSAHSTSTSTPNVYFVIVYSSHSSSSFICPTTTAGQLEQCTWRVRPDSKATKVALITAHH